MIRRLLNFLTAAAVFLALSLAVTSAAQAAVFIPNKTTDSAGACTPQSCSLREAVLAANQNPGDDVILLHTGTYTLTLPGKEDLAATGDLDVLGNLVLIGDGAASTVIDGGGLDRIFQVPGGVTFEIRDVTLRNGRAPGVGGAICNEGNLTITRSILTGNSSIAGSDGPGFGGALYSHGSNASLTVSASTIADNSSQAGGGGLAAGEILHLANVTLSGNHASADLGGGLYLFGSIHATINNITVAENTALRAGGLFVESNPFIGIAPVISNSIIAGNVAPNQPDCQAAVDSQYNLIGIADTTCIGPSAANHDIVGTTTVPIVAKLGTLQAAGGPTPTRPLGPGSPAIDHGSPATPGSGGRACEATDQRGATRSGTGTGTTCDIGAYEVTTACVDGGGVLCLSSNRFRVTADWKTGTGATGSGQGVELTPDSGYFWFFGPDNVELTVKVLNACTFNNKYWVFISGLTNVEVNITVVDTKTGTIKLYTNPQGQTFKTVLDTSAFGTCP